MNPEPDSIKRRIKDALETLAREQGDEVAARIRSILYTNLDRGRLESCIEGDWDLLLAYVRGVAERYTRLHHFLYQLQIEHSTATWEPLFERMVTWAYHFLVRKGFAGGPGTQEIAEERATEAAIAMLDAYFPYDIEFDPWAHVLVQNICRKFMRTGTKKSAVPDGKVMDLDGLSEALQDPAPGNGMEQHETREELEQALASLPQARREVIRSIYFEDIPADEVARKMSKTVGAIYSLQFHGLEDLRKILRKIRNSINE